MGTATVHYTLNVRSDPPGWNRPRKKVEVKVVEVKVVMGTG